MRISINKLQSNTGQIDGVPKNPRYIKDERFNKLKQSLQDDPAFTELNPILVYQNIDGNYIVMGGNMRFRAAKDLGWKEIEASVMPADTSIELLRARIIKHNVDYGTDDWDLLANEWNDAELESFGLELPGDFSDQPLSDNPPAEPQELNAIAIVAYKNVNDLDKITDLYNLETIDITDDIKNDISGQRKVYVFKQ